MDLSQKTTEQIEELRILEANLDNLLAQKQSIQVELNELNNALEEVKKSSGEIYKVSMNIMLKSEKNSVIKELEEKKKIIEIKLNSIEKQESLLEPKAEKIRNEINEEIRKKK